MLADNCPTWLPIFASVKHASLLQHKKFHAKLFCKTEQMVFWLKLLQNKLFGTFHHARLVLMGERGSQERVLK
jgi:hypothetical protein